jgi:surfeit locus 1 family protein
MHDPAPPPAMRWPVIPTLLVAAAVLTMIGLGVWQLQRKGEKEAMIALHQRNIALSAEVAFPELGPVDAALYFRRSTVICLEPISFSPRAGQDGRGQSTYRTIVDCRTGAEGPGVLIAVGTHADPARKPAWMGGTVQGVIVPGPDQPSLLDRLAGRAVPARALLVADPPVPGWGSNARPAPDQQPNNHLAYAVQWFVFAAAAAGIYVLALRKRLRG